MLQKMANVPCGAVTPCSGFQCHPKSRRSEAVSTSQSPKSKQFSFARFCYACGTPNLFMPAIWSPTLLASCCASQADYTHCDGLPRNGSHVAGCSGNAGSCNSQPCMLWLPIHVQVIDMARIFSASCTWHGHPGLQAGQLQATVPQPQWPKLQDSSTKASVSNEPYKFVCLAKLQTARLTLSNLLGLYLQPRLHPEDPMPPPPPFSI